MIINFSSIFYSWMMNIFNTLIPKFILCEIIDVIYKISILRFRTFFLKIYFSSSFIVLMYMFIITIFLECVSNYLSFICIIRCINIKYYLILFLFQNCGIFGCFFVTKNGFYHRKNIKIINHYLTYIVCSIMFSLFYL